MRKFSTSTTGCNGLNLFATRSSYSTTYAIGYRLRHIDFGRPGVRGSNVMDGGGVAADSNESNGYQLRERHFRCLRCDFWFLDGQTMFDNNRSIINISI